MSAVTVALSHEVNLLYDRVSQLEQFVINQREINHLLTSNLSKLAENAVDQQESVKLLLENQEMLAEKLLGVKR